MTPTPPPDRPRRRRSRVRLAAGAVVVLLVFVTLVGLPLYVFPARTSPGDLPRGAGRADAMLLLGGQGPESVRYAEQLMDRGVARELLLSAPGLDHVDGLPVARPDHAPTPRSTAELAAKLRLCRDPGAHPAWPVHCFQPYPSTTRGEGIALRRMAAEHGWHRVIVVTSSFHVSRARLVVSRCFAGHLDLVTSPTGRPWWYWAYQYGYETAGFVKAFLVHPGC